MCIRDSTVTVKICKIIHKIIIINAFFILLSSFGVCSVLITHCILILLFNSYFFNLWERAINCFSVYFSVSTYFIVTGLSGEEALVCRTCTFGDLYAGIGTILGIAGIYLIAIGTLYLTPFKHCCLWSWACGQGRSRKYCLCFLCCWIASVYFLSAYIAVSTYFVIISLTGNCFLI